MQSENTSTNWNEEQQAARAERLELVIDKLSELVCEHGPNLLTRGMSMLEANEAILQCLEGLLNKTKALEALCMKLEQHKNEEEAERRQLAKLLEKADKIINLLPAFNVGQSFLSEERVQELMEDYRDRN